MTGLDRVPVRIRGVDYPSINEAARQLKISSSTINYHLEMGSIDKAGLGRKGKHHGQSIEIKIHGYEFESQSDLAKQVGVSVMTISRWRRLGVLRSKVTKEMLKCTTQS